MSVYCLSSIGLIENNYYKIGKTTKTQIELEAQYTRYLPSVKTIKFIKVKNESLIERQLHESLDSYRVGSSEWFRCDIKKISALFTSLLQDNINKDYNDAELRNLVLRLTSSKLKNYLKIFNIKGRSKLTNKKSMVNVLTKSNIFRILKEEKIISHTYEEKTQNFKKPKKEHNFRTRLLEKKKTTNTSKKIEELNYLFKKSSLQDKKESKSFRKIPISSLYLQAIKYGMLKSDLKVYLTMRDRLEHIVNFIGRLNIRSFLYSFGYQSTMNELDFVIKNTVKDLIYISKEKLQCYIKNFDLKNIDVSMCVGVLNRIQLCTILKKEGVMYNETDSIEILREKLLTSYEDIFDRQAKKDANRSAEKVSEKITKKVTVSQTRRNFHIKLPPDTHKIPAIKIF